MFDITLLPLQLNDGVEINQLPGLFIIRAPARCERSRSKDILVFLLSMSRDTSPEFIQGIIDQASQIYFRSRGSTPSILRAAADKINLAFLEKNRQESADTPIQAMLQIGALRQDVFTLAQIGPVNTILVRNTEQEDLSEDPDATRLMGTRSDLVIQYTQAQIEPGNLLILSPTASPVWKSGSLAGISQLTYDQLRRKLLHQADPNFQAVVIQFQSGKGQMRLLRPKHPLATMDETRKSVEPLPIPMGSPDIPRENLSPQSDQPLPDFTTKPIEDLNLPESAHFPASDPLIPAPKTVRAWATEPPNPDGDTGETGVQPIRRITTGKPIKTRQKSLFNEKVKPYLARLWVSGQNLGSRVNLLFQSGTKKIIPGGTIPSLPPSTMLFITIAVPLIIAAAATTVYYRTGRSSQHKAYLEQALSAQTAALAQTEPNLKRESLVASLEWLDQADAYGQSQESGTLRNQVQQALDTLEGIVRIGLIPAQVGQLPTDLIIEKLSAANNGDLYALDRNSGRILRFTLSSQGYQMEKDFNCIPGPVGALSIGKLVDLRAIPMDNPYNASVVAIDRDGQLLYCAQGNDPQSEKLVLPSNGWGKITAISIDQGYLYVLDPQNNAVWSYAGEKQKYLAGPRIFFNSIPEGIQTAVDIAVMDEELYMLRNDGSIIWCTFGNFECIDPAVLRDARPGRNSQEVSFPQSLFTKIETTRPPDPSLFLLSEKEKSIYHFSLQLNLQKIFAPMDNSEYPVPKNPITAFVIAPGQKLVVATANQLFSAQLP